MTNKDRWLNGSLFAAVRSMTEQCRSQADCQVYALIHVSQIWRSDHSGMRKLALMVESVYNALNLVFTWFALANFYIFFVSMPLLHLS